jgi:hypothetical protein
MAEININKAFQEVFGIYSKVPYFPSATTFRRGSDIGEPNFPEAEREEEFDTELEYLRENMGGQLLQDRYEFGHPELGTYVLSPYTILEISRAKNIVTTAMQGRNGTVKEFISLDDWVLVFRGFLINEESNTLPSDQTRRLVEVFEKNEHLRFFSDQVRKWYENRAEVEEGAALEYIVVEDLKFPPFDGADNVQPFEITCKSDNPVEIEILLLDA